MLTAASDTATFEPAQAGWQFTGWAGPSIAGAVSTRRDGAEALLRSLGAPAAASAEQVHGASIACLGPGWAGTAPVPGCDALITDRPGLALLIRSADCLPILYADPSRRVVGIAHAGWRGVHAGLPQRMLSALWTQYRVPAASLRVAIGPAIRSCCFEVGPEFDRRFAGFMRQDAGRRTCDLIAAARRQLEQGGVPSAAVTDAGRCTACDTGEWFSLRREGASTGRLTSLVLLQP